MGFLDKAKGLLKGREQQVKQGIDKVADVVDSKTKGKYSKQVDTAQEKAGEAIDKLSPQQQAAPAKVAETPAAPAPAPAATEPVADPAAPAPITPATTAVDPEAPTDTAPADTAPAATPDPEAPAAAKPATKGE